MKEIKAGIGLEQDGGGSLLLDTHPETEAGVEREIRLLPMVSSCVRDSKGAPARLGATA